MILLNILRIYRVIIRGKTVLIFDEPTSADNTGQIVLWLQVSCFHLE